MSHKTIRSKWQDFIECYKKGAVLVTLGNGVLRLPNRLRSWNKEILDQYLMIGDGELSDTPHYVFANETKEIIRSRQTIETIELLKRFGKYRLPHQMCMAEHESDQAGIRIFTLCYEKGERSIVSPEDAQFPFFVAVFGLYDFSNPETAKYLKSKSGRLITDKYAVLFPIICEIDNIGSDIVFVDSPDATEDEKLAGGVRYRSAPTPWIQIHLDEGTPDAPINEHALTQEFIAHGGFAIRAMTAMMQTKGIAQENLTLDDVKKLNKKRAQSKTAGLIPAHTYVTLGHTYNKSGQRDAVPNGVKQRFHLRSAHTKMQPYGPNNSLRKEIFVEAYLVNADQGGELYNPVRIVKP